jgi:hypothetical protein
VNCPYPGLAAGIVGVIVALAPGIVTWEEVQAAGVQRVVAVPLDRDDPGRIASRGMVAVVVLLNPAGAGVVVALLFPMLRSIYRVPPGTRKGCHYSSMLTVPGTREGCSWCLAPARGATTVMRSLCQAPARGATTSLRLTKHTIIITFWQRKV